MLCLEAFAGFTMNIYFLASFADWTLFNSTQKKLKNSAKIFKSCIAVASRIQDTYLVKKLKKSRRN